MSKKGWFTRSKSEEGDVLSSSTPSSTPSTPHSTTASSLPKSSSFADELRDIENSRPSQLPSKVLATLSEELSKPILDVSSLNAEMLDAARRGNLGVLKACLASGADINYSCKEYHWTALIHSSREGHYHVVRFLLNTGANPNKPDILGSTALHRASYRGHYEVVCELLRHGADPTIEDNLTQTANHVAVQEARWKIHKKLERAEAKWLRKLEKQAKQNSKGSQQQTSKEMLAKVQEMRVRHATVRLDREAVEKLEKRMTLARHVGVLKNSSSSLINTMPPPPRRTSLQHLTVPKMVFDS